MLVNIFTGSQHALPKVAQKSRCSGTHTVLERWLHEMKRGVRRAGVDTTPAAVETEPSSKICGPVARPATSLTRPRPHINICGSPPAHNDSAFGHQVRTVSPLGPCVRHVGEGTMVSSAVMLLWWKRASLQSIVHGSEMHQYEPGWFDSCVRQQQHFQH